MQLSIRPDLTRRVCKDWEPEQKGVPSTLFRDHPLLHNRGIPSWPPTRTWMGDGEGKSPNGEVGILRQVLESHIQPANRCFLFIDHEESSYGGVLTVDNHDFCAKLVRFLQTEYNRLIAEIGGLEIPHTF